MSTLITNIGELVINDPAGSFSSLTGAALIIDGGQIAWTGPAGRAPAADDLVDARGRAVLPGFVDSHAHLVFAGEDHIAVLKKWGKRVKHVHLKDVRPQVLARVRKEKLSFLEAVKAGAFTVPGDGCVDYPSVFAELKGYSGWVVIEAEQDPAKANPLKYAQMGYAYLTKALADAGMR